MNMTSMLDEFVKISRTRAAEEAAKAFKSGDTSTLRQIGRASEQLGLSPRYVGDVHSGGAEGAVDLMIGKRKGIEGGLIARKLHRPESAITRGDVTTGLLEQKQKAVDALRQTPEVRSGKVVVPAMGGFDVLHGDKAPGMMRHVSYNEYVPGLRGDFKVRGPHPLLDIGPAEDLVSAIKKKDVGKAIDVVQEARQSPLSQAHRAIQGAQKQTGQAIGDVVMHRLPGGLVHAINPGNIQLTAEGKPAIIDVLPGDKKFLKKMMGQRQALLHGPQQEVMQAALAGESRGPAMARMMEAMGGAGTDSNLSTLRREIFNPTKAVSHGEKPSTLRDVAGLGRAALRRLRKLR